MLRTLSHKCRINATERLCEVINIIYFTCNRRYPIENFVRNASTVR